MKRFIYIALAIALAGCTADLESQRVSTGGSDYSDKIVNSSQGGTNGVLLVRFNSSAESRLAECATRAGATRTGIESVDTILDQIDGFAVEPVFKVTEKNREKVHSSGLHLWYELQFSKKCDIDAAAIKLAQAAEIERVQFSYDTYTIVKPKRATTTNVSLADISRSAKAAFPFNDPYNYFQWNLNNTGEGSSVGTWGDIEGLPAPVAGSDVNAIPAWKLCKGDPSILVAVLDEGVMYSHEDLRDNMWVNQAELNGRRGVDDDGNGYEDDIYGYNFTDDTPDISWNVKGDSGHGTHVAGIISAVNNNGIGISSIAGGSGNNDGVKILALQMMTGGASTSTKRIVRAMHYAADCGAHIMQCSWGLPSSTANKQSPSSDKSYYYIYSIEADAIKHFIENGGSEDGPMKGGLAIFAAGNDSGSLPGYPSAYEPCISVAAMGPALRPPYYTNYGPGTDIMAPGGDPLYINGSILSTVPPQYSTSPNTINYEMYEGTSMACPMVSGIAALGLSYAKQLGKKYTPQEFRSMLLSSTHDIEPYLFGSYYYTDLRGMSKLLNFENFRGGLGAGYIDAYKLLLQIDGTPYTTIKTGEEYAIDLAPYFGSGVHTANFKSVEISDQDKENIGLSEYSYSDGKLLVTCANSGVATIKVTMLVGGGSLGVDTKPFPTEVSKTFVIISKASVTSNGGWL